MWRWKWYRHTHTWHGINENKAQIQNKCDVWVISKRYPVSNIRLQNSSHVPHSLINYMNTFSMKKKKTYLNQHFYLLFVQFVVYIYISHSELFSEQYWIVVIQYILRKSSSIIVYGTFIIFDRPFTCKIHNK